MLDFDKEKPRWSTEIRWMGTDFPQEGGPDDPRPGKHRWEDLRPPRNYECAPWVRHLFRQSQTLRSRVVRVSTSPVANIRQVQDLVDPNVDLHLWKISPPNIAEIGQPFKCDKCGAVTWIEVGRYLQCRPCNRRRQKKWREAHREEKRALDRHRM